MTCKNRDVDEIAPSPNSSSLSDALLFATLCIVGLPVDVYVKDGSVYSGIFYTASVDGDYEIVLKKAKLTRKGRGNTNVASGKEVETLVVLSADLVQVVAKSVLLPSDGVIGNANGEKANYNSGNIPDAGVKFGDVERCADSGLKGSNWNYSRSAIQNENHSCGLASEKIGRKQEGKDSLMNEVEVPINSKQGMKDGIVKLKDVGASASNRETGVTCLPQEEYNDKHIPYYQEDNDDTSSSSSIYSNPSPVKPIREENASLALDPQNAGTRSITSAPSKAGTGPLAGNVPVGTSSSTSAANFDPELCQSSLKQLGNAVSSKLSSNKSKEFKLNPGAKDFSPSFTKPAGTVMSPMSNMAYIHSGNYPAAGVGAASQLDGVISSISSLLPMTSKFISYGNPPAEGNGGAFQLSQPVVNHMSNRAQPIRHSPYHSTPAAPMLLNSNSQVMVGRLGQLMYVQPVAQDFVPGIAAIPQLARPMQQFQVPKHQGNGIATGQAVQVCSPQHCAPAAGQLPSYAMPQHIPVLQPVFPAHRPIPVPCSNGLFTPKFP